MVNELFVFSLLIVLGSMLVWGFRVLPQEGWQILATLPIRPLGDGQWHGVNLTWYGLLTANAYMIAMTMMIIMLGAVQVPLTGVIMVAIGLLALCIPSSRLVARIVEGKAHTFTVGGAVFIGNLAAPWLVLIVAKITALQLPVLVILAAVSISYAYGEGLGRLACISFGCCYGKPVSQCGPFAQRIFSHWNFSFHGETRKISYASGLEGEPVVPIQAITSILHVAVGLLGTELFLHGKYLAAFTMTTIVTLAWRVASEFLRADFRGNNRFSAYQIMSLISIPYALTCAIYFNSANAIKPQLELGLINLWQPGIILSLQVIWFALFIYTGRSTVTGANLSFYVHSERI